MGDPTNTAANTVNDIIYETLSAGESAIEAVITIEQPWLANPIGRAILNFFLGIIGDAIYKQIAQLLTAMVIDIQVNGESSKAVASANSLMAVLEKGDQSAIDQASKDFDTAYEALIHWDGAATDVTTPP